MSKLNTSRISLTLTVAQYNALRKESERSGETMATLIRRLVSDRYVQKPSKATTA